MKPSDIDGSIPVGDEQDVSVFDGHPRLIWVITHDLLWDQSMIADGCKCRVGAGNAGDRSERLLYLSQYMGLLQFKLSDDDGMPYYIGCMSMSDGSDPMESPRLMEPLHDFGGPDAGCTSMHVFSKEKGWELV
jgi:hypothetical protein